MSPAPAADLPPDLPPFILHYQILQRLGVGSFGEVLLARDTQLDRLVALKWLKPEVLGDTRARARIAAEARLLARLSSPSHPGILTLFGIHELSRGLLLVFEYLDGGSLADRLKQRRLGLAEVCRIGRDAALALDYAHAHSIVHRDIKPANLLFSRDGQLKVADFGLAHFQPDASVASPATASITQTGTLVGTVPYMAPEQLRQLPATALSDQFALVVTLYECATGARPFNGEHIFAVARVILNQEPEWERPPASLLDPGLRAVLRRGLRKDPAGRYPDMASLARDLQALLDRPPDVVIRPPQVRPAARLVARDAELHRLHLLIAGLDAPGGHGQGLLVTGEAGIGKTALVEELLRQMHVVTSPPPMVQDGFREGRRGYRPVTSALDRIQSSAGLAAPASPTTGAPAESIDETLTALATAGPFLVVIENIHLADADGLRALRVALAALPATRGLLLLTCRTEPMSQSGGSELRDFAAWARGERLIEEMALAPLGESGTAALMEQIIGGPKAPDPVLVRRIQAETEGNPLFVQELVRHLLDSGRLESEADSAETTRMPLPRVIQDVLARRLEPLDPPVRRTIEAAAIAGERFLPEVVAGILEQPLAAVVADLARLEHDHGLVATIGNERRFRHARIRDVVLDRLEATRRVELHGRMAERLQASADSRPADLARHLVAAGRAMEAIPHLLAGARRASAGGALAEARELSELAFACFADRPSPQDDPGYARLLYDLAKYDAIAGDTARARERLERVEALCEDDLNLCAMAIHDLGWIALREGNHRRARQLLARARTSFLAAGNRTWAAACRDAIGVAYRLEGRLKPALREAEAALAERVRLRFAPGIALSRSNLGAIHYALGDAATAHRYFDRARRFLAGQAHDIDGRRKLAIALLNLGAASLDLGHYETALSVLAEGLELNRRLGARIGQAMTLLNLADVQAAMGLRLAATDAYERALRLSGPGDPGLRALALAGLVPLQAAAGHAAEARATADQAVDAAIAAHHAEAEARARIERAELARAGGLPGPAREDLARARLVIRHGQLAGLSARLEHTSALLALARGDRALARARLERALGELESKPRPELLWRVEADLARLLDATGQADPAQTHRARARATLQALVKRLVDPILRQSYLADRERRLVLGIEAPPRDAADTL